MAGMATPDVLCFAATCWRARAVRAALQIRTTRIMLRRAPPGYRTMPVRGPSGM